MMTLKERNEAILKHQGMAVSVSRGFHKSNKDLNISDCESVALSLLCEAAAVYYQSGQTFGQFAKMKIKRGLIDWSRQERKHSNKKAEFEDVYEDKESGIDDRLELEKILSCLSEEEKWLLVERSQGARLQEIAEAKGVSHPTISRWAASALKEVKNSV